MRRRSACRQRITWKRRSSSTARATPSPADRLDEVIAKAKISIESVTAEHAQIARSAYRDFGKGSGHPASLNFGDCFAHALAKATGERLLFRGNDFAQTM